MREIDLSAITNGKELSPSVCLYWLYDCWPFLKR